MNKPYLKKTQSPTLQKDKASAPHSDLLLISFLIPVIALSGVKSEAGHDSS